MLLKTLFRNLGGVNAADAARAAVDAHRLLTGGDAAAAARVLSPFVRTPARHADVAFVQGLVEKSRGGHERAAGHFREAIRLREPFAAAWSELSAVLTAMHDLEGALAAIERAAELEPSVAGLQQNLGYLRYRVRDVEGAVRALTKAVASAPALAEAHFNLADALLASGDFARGWVEYEWRPPSPSIEACRLPRWDGDPAQRLAVIAEQGLGDQILFARLLPRIAARAAHVAVFVPPALLRLLEQSKLASDVRLLDSGAEPDLAAFDAFLPFMSLARATALSAPERAVSPYLSAHPRDLAAWQARLGPRDGTLRVGVAWAGNPGRSLDYERSMTPDAFAPLWRISGVSFYSLQLPRDPRSAAFPLIDHTQHFADLAQTAAMISQLDLVVTVDTAVAHLAGALGIPAWVLGPLRADWRWEIAGEPSPWYSGVRIFRATKTAHWTPVIDSIAAALAERVRSR